MSEPSETVILCEGYHDRAFWSGWLKHLGCSVPHLPVKDPWGTTVSKGQYAFFSKSSKFVRVTPCEGKSNIMRAVRLRLNERSLKPLERLVINVDPDTSIATDDAAQTGLRTSDVLAQVQQIDTSAKQNSDGDIVLDGGASVVSLVRWEVNDEVTPGILNQQTLERLVCSALVAAYPQRGACVHNWLDMRHEPPSRSVKEYAWSHMAGWYADHGCDDFYRCLWDDAGVVVALEERLEQCGAMHIVRALTQ